jgi:uncharacterized SAM-binding protein YcdF (DUF218 family)
MEEIFNNMHGFGIFNIFALLLLALFILSVWRDRRRFRNAILLQAVLIGCLAAIFLDVQGTDAALLLSVIIIVFLFLLLVLVPFLLIINGFIMVKREGFSLSNVLALLFSLLIMVGEFSSMYSVIDVVRDRSEASIIVAFLFGGTVFFISMVFLAFLVYSVFVCIIPRRRQYDYVVVLGSGLLHGDTVSKLLSERIDQGIKVYQRSGHAKLILSGGQGADEKISEAQAMKNYALTKGVKEEDILLEDKSSNTMENLHNSKELIDQREGGHTAAVVTSQYHVMRACVYAEALHFPIEGIGAHTAFYYWPAAITREYVGLVKHYWKTYLFCYILYLIPLIWIVVVAFRPE